MTLLAYLFVALAVALRLLPHPFHFTPVAASLLFFGARVDRKRLWVPVALLAASDYYLTVYHYGYSFSWEYLVTFAWYAGMVLIGGLLKNRESVGRIVGASLTASVSFFAISNGMVWALSTMYPKTLGGLATCYAAGIPFFRSTLVSDLFFTAIAFGTPYAVAAVERMMASHQHRAAA
jgi:hypothetical protein